MTIQQLDEHLISQGVRFLPHVGEKYSEGFRGRKFLVLGESHYSTWKGQDHSLEKNFTRECIEGILDREDGVSRFWKNLELGLLNVPRVNGWCPSGGRALWERLAFYNFLQVALLAPGHRPTDQQFSDSWEPFKAVLKLLRPERVLVCGKDLWNRGMDRTDEELHPDVQAYGLANGVRAWCLAIRHPSRRLPWHELVMAFLDDPHRAADLLLCTSDPHPERGSS